MVLNYTTSDEQPGARTVTGYVWDGNGWPGVSSSSVVITPNILGIDSRSKFEKAAEKIGKIVTEKNAEYGNSAIESGEILKELYGDSIQIDTTNMLLVARILDKLSRISHAKDVQTVLDACLDIAGYALIGYCKALEDMEGGQTVSD